MSNADAFSKEGMPDGIQVMPATDGTQPHVFLLTQNAVVNGSYLQLGPWSALEAGEIAYAILEAIPRAIALQLEASVARVADAIADDLMVEIEAKNEANND